MKKTIKEQCEKNAVSMLQNAYKFDSTPPDSIEARRAETPVMGKTRGEIQ